jgi:hypothetical protein
MGVNGGGLQLGVAQHFLDIPHVAAALQQKRRKGQKNEWGRVNKTEPVRIEQEETEET